MQETANELETYNTRLAALQETRWLNDGLIKNDYTLMCGRETNIRGRNGQRFHIR